MGPSFSCAFLRSFAFLSHAAHQTGGQNSQNVNGASYRSPEEKAVSPDIRKAKLYLYVEKSATRKRKKNVSIFNAHHFTVKSQFIYF